MSVERGVCVLVFGASGVGKSAACSDFQRHHPEWLCLRASDLLSRTTRRDPEALRTSPPRVIQANQELLGPAFLRERRGRESAPVLIEAHAVIDNDEVLVPVANGVVAELDPDGMILLEVTPEELTARRANDPRPRPLRAYHRVIEELVLERSVVRGYADALDLPLVIGNVASKFKLDPLIDELLKLIGVQQGLRPV
jgi:adenylate kinase